MNAKQLRSKHKRERQNKRVKMVINVIRIVTLIVVMVAGIELFLQTWEKEMDIQAQKNIEWQTTHSR